MTDKSEKFNTDLDRIVAIFTEVMLRMRRIEANASVNMTVNLHMGGIGTAKIEVLETVQVKK